MSLDLLTLELVLSCLALALAGLVLLIMMMRMYREWRAAVGTQVRQVVVDALLHILDAERGFAVDGRTVMIDGRPTFVVPKPGGAVGDAVRETLVDHLSFISGDLRGRLVTILESGGYVVAAMRQLRSPLGEVRLRACRVS